MAKAQTKTKRKRKATTGRPPGKKSITTQRWEFLRDVVLPTIAKAHNVDDPVEAIAAWMNESPENKEWFMKAAMETCFNKRVTTDISEEEIQIEKIRAQAQQDNQGQGGANTFNLYTGQLPVPNTAAGQLTASQEIIDVESEEVEIKQLEQKDDTDCLD